MKFTRRSILQGFSLTSVLSLLPSALTAAPKKKGLGIYEELGLRPVINFRGTHTTIGASKEWPELHEAAAEASRHYIVLEELQEKIGERLSRLIGCEDAMVTTGAAGAICLGTCACLTGSEVARVKQLPDLTGMKTEVIIQKVHRNGYDHAVRNTGVRIIEVESEQELVNAVNGQTAMLYFLGGSSRDYKWETPVSLERCLQILKKVNVPVMVDAANMLPPWDNIRHLAAIGVDLICISGGKHMRGPQCSGILAGRKDLIEAAWLNSSPHSDSLGRPMKVGREEMVACWQAVEKYARLDFDKIDRECERQAAYILKELSGVPGLRLSKAPFDRTRKIHRVQVEWDQSALALTPAEAEEQLMAGDPRVAVGRWENGLELTVFMNDPGDEQVAVKRLKQVLQARD